MAEVEKTKLHLLAKQLYKASRDGTMLVGGGGSIGNAALDMGYRVQDHLLQLKVDGGDVHIGYKIALTTASIQELMGLQNPVYGHLTLSNLLLSGSDVSLSSMNSPLIEPELVFKVAGLSEDLSNCRTPEEMLKHVLIAPGIEIADSRYVEWPTDVGLFEFVSDAAAAQFVVVGEFSNVEHLSSDTPVALFENGHKVQQGVLGNIMGDNPLVALYWLVRELAAQNTSLPFGSIVFTGSLTDPAPAARGTYKGQFGSLGSVEVSLS